MRARKPTPQSHPRALLVLKVHCAKCPVPAGTLPVGLSSQSFQLAWVLGTQSHQPGPNGIREGSPLPRQLPTTTPKIASCLPKPDGEDQGCFALWDGPSQASPTPCM